MPVKTLNSSRVVSMRILDEWPKAPKANPTTGDAPPITIELMKRFETVLFDHKYSRP